MNFYRTETDTLRMTNINDGHASTYDCYDIDLLKNKLYTKLILINTFI